MSKAWKKFLFCVASGKWDSMPKNKGGEVCLCEGCPVAKYKNDVCVNWDEPFCPEGIAGDHRHASAILVKAEGRGKR